MRKLSICQFVSFCRYTIYVATYVRQTGLSVQYPHHLQSCDRWMRRTDETEIILLVASRVSSLSSLPPIPSSLVVGGSIIQGQVRGEGVARMARSSSHILTFYLPSHFIRASDTIRFGPGISKDCSSPPAMPEGISGNGSLPRNFP